MNLTVSIFMFFRVVEVRLDFRNLHAKQISRIEALLLYLLYQKTTGAPTIVGLVDLNQNYRKFLS